MNPFRLLFTRASLPLVFMFLEIGLIAFMVILFKETSIYFFWFSLVLSIIVVISIVNNSIDSAYKISWLIPVLYLPIFGSLLYLFYGGNKFGKKTRIEIKKLSDKTSKLLVQDPAIIEKIKSENIHAANQAMYITNNAYSPICDNSNSEYFKAGELAFRDIVSELEKAKRYIFIEYFIIEDGIMWGTILEILKKKAAAGVDVRVIYDDIGCLFTLPGKYNKYLESYGIKCQIFHPLKLLFSTKYNNRDHRKILVIDGNTAYTGGINLADEYINVYEKYGHWKDCAIKIRGRAVSNFTILFLTMWEYLSKEVPDYDRYLIESHNYKLDMEKNNTAYNDGFIQPFSDNPLDDEALGENVYCNILGNAKYYAYITTPYLIINDAMKTSICSAAKRGVDVRIIVPHIPDKWYVHSVSKSNYEDLLKSNVRIYEYTPGFIHSKLFVSDDEFGVVGTINLDYRSLYLHFECGVWMYKSKSIAKIKEDILETLKVSEEISLQNKKAPNVLVKGLRSFLRTLSPLM